MRKLMLGLAIAAAIASPVAIARGGGGPQGGGVGIGVGTGGQGNVGGIHGNVGGSIGTARGGVSADGWIGVDAHASDRGLGRQGSRSDLTPQQAVFGLSTAERAGLLRDADLATRKAFGTYQSALAKAMEKQGRMVAHTLSAQSASRAEISAFGADTAARARELKDASRSARRAFGKFQSALAREQQLAAAAGADAEASAFGQDTAARAHRQGDADVQTRRTSGSDQSTRAQAMADQKPADPTVDDDR